LAHLLAEIGGQRAVRGLAALAGDEDQPGAGMHAGDMGVAVGRGVVQAGRVGERDGGGSRGSGDGHAGLHERLGRGRDVNAPGRCLRKYDGAGRPGATRAYRSCGLAARPRRRSGMLAGIRHEEPAMPRFTCLAASLLAVALGGCAAPRDATAPSPSAASAVQVDSEYGFRIAVPAGVTPRQDFSGSYLAGQDWKAYAEPGSQGVPRLAMALPGSNRITTAELRIGV